MPTDTPRVMLAVCVLPPVAALVLLVAVCALEIAGREPFALPRPGNLAEAAFSGHAPEVARRLHEGEDARRVVTVRRGFGSRASWQVSAFEAAVMSRSARLVLLLERGSAPLDAELRHHLACLAIDIKAADVAAAVSPETPACANGETRREIARRSGLL